MSSQPSNLNPQDFSQLISAAVEAVITQNQATLNQLLNQIIFVIPSQYSDETSKAKTARQLLIYIVRELENTLKSSNHATIAWFVVYVGLGSSPSVPMQAVQMVLDQGFKAFEDFFVDRQGIHFYDEGATKAKLDKMPQRLSEFTQMTVTVDLSEVNQVREKFNLSETQARQVLMNLKILEQKMNIPAQNLLGVLEQNNELLQQVLNTDLTGSDENKNFDRFGE